jgi:hypothetical protein
MTFNPGMLDIKEEFSHASLIKLCKRITASGQGPISHEGSRIELVARLRKWHDLRKDGKKGQKGNNFHFVRVKEEALPDKYKSPFKPMNTPDVQKSILRKTSKYPLADVPEKMGSTLRTPKAKTPKSISSSPGSDEFLDARSNSASPAVATPVLRLPTPCKTPLKACPIDMTPTTRKRRLCFSPYNRVQLISPRRANVPSPIAASSTESEKSDSPERHVVPNSPPPKRRQVQGSPRQSVFAGMITGVQGLVAGALSPSSGRTPSPQGWNPSPEVDRFQSHA